MSHSARRMTDYDTSGADGWKVLASACDSVFRLLARLLAEQRCRKAIRELECLDDRLLTDIGTTRCGIKHVVRYGVDAIASEPRVARYPSTTWLVPGALTLVALFSIGLLFV
jgi:uncharacterized protein YjiS (DUF1127 family)